MSSIGPLTEGLLNACLGELKKKETREKISKHVVDPIVGEITSKLWPYFTAHILIQMVIICVLVYIISEIKKKTNIA